jgi:peptidoglycan-associated lipoprotein
MMGSDLFKFKREIINMKTNVWMLCVAIMSAGMIGCAKKQALSPEDTALLKGGDRGTFITGGAENGENDELLSPVGATITGLNGDGLAPQDPFWGDNLANGERPFEPIFFGFDQYNIGADERAKLQDVATYLDANPDARILIEGYCDWKGTPAYNKSLGDRRASSVKQYLTDLGADSNRIDVLSMGDEFATPNADSTTSALERKAHFVVLGGS